MAVQQQYMLNYLSIVLASTNPRYNVKAVGTRPNIMNLCARLLNLSISVYGNCK